MAKHSVLFVFIAVIQLGALLLSFFGHLPFLAKYSWKNFIEVNPITNQGMRLLDENVKTLIYGVWNYCVGDDMDDCHFIEDDDWVVSDDGRMRELNTARVMLCLTNFFSLCTLISACVNAFLDNRITVSCHLFISYFQFMCQAVFACLATHVLRYGDWEAMSVGWGIVLVWVNVGIILLALFISFLTPCLEVSYTTDDDDDQRANSYKMSQNF